MILPMPDTSASFEESLEVVRVAIALGQQVDAVEGMLLYYAYRGVVDTFYPESLGMYCTEEGAWEACCRDIAQAIGHFGERVLSKAEVETIPGETFQQKYVSLHLLVKQKSGMDLPYHVRKQTAVARPSAR